MNRIKKEINLKTAFNILLRGLKHLFLHNGWLKVIAVIISVVLWAGLISQDETITRDKSFQHVNVSVTGTELMKSNGYIVVSDLDTLLDDVSVVAAVPQKQYEKAEASTYNIRLDLSRINGTGEQEIKLQSTNSTTYGRVTAMNPSSVTVQVEDYIIRERIPVSTKVKGDIPEDWSMEITSVDPNLVTVSGPRSLMQTISKAQVYIDTDNIEWAEGKVTDSYKIQLFNRAGEEIDNPLLSITASSIKIDSVLIELNLLPKVLFSTEDLVQVIGSVAPGYQIRKVTISPETMTVAARQEILDQMSTLCSINVEGLKETTVFHQLKVQKPSEDSSISNDSISATVEIEAKEP